MKAVVIGGGAGGINASILLGGAGVDTILIEKNSKLGKKLLATGNGKCNLSHEKISAEKYNNPDFLECCLKKYGAGSMKEYYEGQGIAVCSDGEGRLYPLSNSAQNVADILTGNLKKAHVAVWTETEVNEVSLTSTGLYKVVTDKQTIDADFVIYAGGSAAGGFFSKNPLRLKTTGLRCGLCPLRVSAAESKFLDGMRIQARVTMRYGKKEYIESGEVQFKNGALSGIVLFNAASMLARAQIDTAVISIDLLPDFTESFINSFLSRSNAATAFLALAGILPRGICMNILNRCGIDFDTAPQSFTLKQIKDLSGTIKGLNFAARHSEDFARAQIAVGGIDCKLIDSNTFEVKTSPKLYVVGEALDIDGLCGGYNLHFCVASALIAAQDVADKLH